MTPGLIANRAFSPTRPCSRETKFLVTLSDADRIREWARAVLDADPHGAGPSADEYETNTLYFDTLDRDVFNRRGSFGRGKFRVRRYGNADVVFLERKMRTEGMLVKRRATIPIGELARFVALPARGWPGHWFHKRIVTRGLRPACQIAYTRMARSGSAPRGDIRLTLDENLRVTPSARVAIERAPDVPIFRRHAILELKYVGEMPALFAQLLSDFSLSPEPVSKYRLGAAALAQRSAYDDAAIVTFAARMPNLIDADTRTGDAL